MPHIPPDITNPQDSVGGTVPIHFNGSYPPDIRTVPIVSVPPSLLSLFTPSVPLCSSNSSAFSVFPILMSADGEEMDEWEEKEAAEQERALGSLICC